MAEISRRTLLEGIGAAALAALTPSALQAALPVPPLDIEGWFGAELMANIRRVYELGKINVPEEYAGRPPLLTEDDRFNISAPFRYALAKLLNDGPDILCPDEPGLHRHYESVLRKFGKNAGVPVYGFIGELYLQPGGRVILLTRDKWTLCCARRHWPIDPFGAYQWLGWEDRKGLIVPIVPAVPRPPDMPVPRGRAPTLDEIFSGHFDCAALGLPGTFASGSGIPR